MRLPAAQAAAVKDLEDASDDQDLTPPASPEQSTDDDLVDCSFFDRAIGLRS